MQDTIDFGIYKDLDWDKLSTEYLHGLSDMGNTQAKEQLDKIYSSPIQDQKIGFGKFIGNRWVDLDIDYLYWIVNNIENSNIKYTLASRAIKYIKQYNNNDEEIDVIYVD
jgi:hypothetical protein